MRNLEYIFHTRDVGRCISMPGQIAQLVVAFPMLVNGSATASIIPWGIPRTSKNGEGMFAVPSATHLRSCQILM